MYNVRNKDQGKNRGGPHELDPGDHDPAEGTRQGKPCEGERNREDEARDQCDGPDLERDEQALEDEPPDPDVAERPPAALRQDAGRDEHEHNHDERGQPEIEAQAGRSAAHAPDGGHRANATRRSSRPSTNASVSVSDQ